MKHETVPARGLMFWALAPFLIMFLVVMPFATPVDVFGGGLILVLEALGALTLLGLFNSERFWWAWRAVGGLIFVLCIAYLVSMLIESGGKIEFTPRRSKASSFNAICALIAFGLPGLCFALFGRFTFRREHVEDIYDDEPEDSAA